MKYMRILLGFALVVHVKCQLDVHIDELLYEEDEEDDDEGARTSSTSRSSTTRTRRTTLPPAPARADIMNGTLSSNSTFSNTTSNTNMTFVLKPTNNSIFTGAVSSIFANTGASTERVHYVLNQVGGIFNNVGTLNITGIVDQALGIRNSQFARPLVTGILNAILCNPVTFSENNCKKNG